MKTLIIYKSIHHNNTEKIANAMTKIFNAELIELDKVNITTFSRYDLIGFGSGIYYGKNHKKLLDFVGRLAYQKDKKAFIFSTSGMRKLWFFHEFDKSLKEKLLEKGFSLVGEFNCRGWDTYPFWTKPFGGLNKSRPDEKDLEDARNFARDLKRSK